MNQSEQITGLLAAWSDGDEDSLHRLIPLVEKELRRIAHRYMRRENPEHTLQTTALVNEAYLKMVKQDNLKWQNRAHFFAISANIMRNILINYARDRVAGKRGGKNVEHLNLDDIQILSPESSRELIDLDEALQKLADFDKTKSRIVELKCFGGLTAEEIAQVMGIAAVTVNLHWRLAKAWLMHRMR